MGWVPVGEDGQEGSGTNIVCTTGINVAAGDLIVAYIKWEDVSATVTWAGDEDGSTNELVIGEIGAETDPSGCWAYRLVAQADATFLFKVIFNVSVAFSRILVYVFHPDSGEVVSLDGVYSLLHGISGDPQSSNLTASGSDVVAVGAYGEYQSGVLTNMQIGDVAADDSFVISLTVIWYKIFTSVPGSIHAQATGGGDPWQCGIIVFKSEISGGPFVPPGYTLLKSMNRNKRLRR
jgi:hypothetical protein